MEKAIISGIQQIGVGVNDIKEAWKWYISAFGVDVRIFDDENVADLMAQYMGGKPREKRAVLAINLQGGGGFEIWQHTGREPQKPKFEVQLGDLGIFAAKIKCKDVKKTYEYYQTIGIETLNGLTTDPDGKETFFLKDPYNNFFQLVENNSWYRKERKHTGGTYGAIIGVSNIEESKKVYSSILGYDEVIYDVSDNFNDFNDLPGGKNRFRRILLSHSKPRQGGLSKLLGPSVIELVQVEDRSPKKIYEGRYWGDPGFIHLCYDINGMKILEEECQNNGFTFTVNSEEKHNRKDSFEMGEAAGHFSYIEDPDGTLIEFVETHKIALIRKLGWYLNVKKRNPFKPLPDWMLKASRFNRVKFKKD